MQDFMCPHCEKVNVIKEVFAEQPNLFKGLPGKKKRFIALRKVSNE